VRRGWTHRQGWTKLVRVYALAPSALCPHLLRQDGSLFGFNPVTGVEKSPMNEIETWPGFSRDATSPSCVTRTSLSASCPCNIFPMIEKNHEVGNSEQEHLHCRPQK
jgi:hypothetical protein